MKNQKSRRSLVVAAKMALLLAVPSWASPAAAITVPDDLCTGDPCVISGVQSVDSGSILDFGAREVQVSGTLDVGAGFMTLRARAFTILASGQVRARGSAASNAGSVEIETTDDIVVGGTASSGAFSMAGCDGGILTLSSSNGAIEGAGSINLSRLIAGCFDIGSGGELVILESKSVSLTGDIEAVGGSLGCGGIVEVLSDGDVALGDLNLTGGDCDGGLLAVDSLGEVTLGSIDADGGGESGLGGEILVISKGSVTIAGDITADGASDVGFGGDGGVFEVSAGLPTDPRDISVEGAISLNGRGPDGCGGGLSLDGRDIDVAAAVDVRGISGTSCGGLVDLLATRRLTIAAPLRADSGSSGGASAQLIGDVLTEILATVDLGARGVDGSAGDVVINGQVITVASDVLVNATSGATLGGDVALIGCQVEVLPGVRVEALGDQGRLLFQASGEMILAGDLSAGPSAGSIELQYRDPALPPNIGAASFNVTPSSTQNPILVACNVPACLDGIDNDNDGLVDFPEDFGGCYTPYDISEELDCVDGIDNDGDGFIDFPEDVGCGNATYTIENPKCSDGIDNDGDGWIDFDGAGVGPPDTQCVSRPYRDKEQPGCGLGFEIVFVAAGLLSLRRRRQRVSSGS